MSISMPSLPYIQTNVFVDGNARFSGNQLMTFWDSEANSMLFPDTMQKIAREVNFSETTFVEPSTRLECRARVRIFTPAVEMSFAGHPTLGTAFVLRDRQIIEAHRLQDILELGIGPVEVRFMDDEIMMIQPSPRFLAKFAHLESLAKALDLDPKDFDAVAGPQFVSTGNPFLLVPLVSIEAVQRVRPDAKLLLQTLKGLPSQDVVVFSRETVRPESHVHVRTFTPEFGIVEDPATGSAAGPLAAFLDQNRLLKKHIQGEDILIEQGYEIGRPSRLVANTEWKKSAIFSVKVRGSVKKTAEGNYFL